MTQYFFSWIADDGLVYVRHTEVDTQVCDMPLEHCAKEFEVDLTKVRAVVCTPREEFGKLQGAILHYGYQHKLSPFNK